jgi:hypothetical protein
VIDPLSREEGIFTWEDGEIKDTYRRQVPAEWEPLNFRTSEQTTQADEGEATDGTQAY